ncbi:Alpha-glucosidase, glycosyl hydrolase family GH31 [Pedococcus dokdonensis]|uniref:Alpha-glucosidase, glycosyl hydrolase family GH31 n=1 Tax=Pedococcus dokdonensis TaxID=443156 RepID=A0A1H0SIB7_9MICO|nr:TIM-barrel domain-containing protein [Pedococcus dokdonensis]SDP41531.1 Alpha-glucosidase, glycosyl hydrolase family GH31 [Pedococcus dokdonensis]
MSERLSVPGNPIAHDDATITGEHWRITVLTPGLLRMEWSESGEFEDRASTFAVNRALPVPEVDVQRHGERVELTTDCLHLAYDGAEFSPSGLVVTATSPMSGTHTSEWRFGEPADGLGGTARTLDDIDGAVPLGPGVVSRTGIAVIDDSDSFLIEGGAAAVRREGTKDLYVFARGHDFRAAVADLYAVSGPVPMLPRWALGNWWSRYHPYSADEYLELLDTFEAEHVPLSVAVLDMDWHWVDIDKKYGTGWTGYSWNRDLFPDPPALLAELHRRGLAVTLNVHPADGVRAFEDAYPKVAEDMGVDPGSERPIPFDPTDSRFMDSYFSRLHHPLEDEGVDFWWLDWQQGAFSRTAGVDPLWILNIEHFNDSARRGQLPITFSRYAGPGSHRYPVGFSGDAHITWDSLAFQPYFTASASNIGYGWWSHDIGGHWYGSRDDDLTVRWVQLGVFSPIMRLHSTLHPFIRKEPWTFPAQARAIIDAQLRLRHRLVPYLHTMNARAARDGAPLVEPMYWGDPEAWDAYGVPTQFRFGTELVVAPITAPQAEVLGLGSVQAWLPDGEWTDLFTGTRYRGGRHVRLHRAMETLPVLLCAGGLLPLAGTNDESVGTELPAHVEVVLAPGADGAFELVEDDGATSPRTATTRIAWDDASGTLTVEAATGDADVLPAQRSWAVLLLGARAQATVGGAEVDGEATTAGTRFAIGGCAPSSSVSVTLHEIRPFDWTRTVEQVRQLLDRARIDYNLKLAAHDVVRRADGPVDAAARLRGLELDHEVEAALLELVLASY